MATRVKKRFDILVTAANQKFPESFQLDKTISSIKGIMLTSNRDDLLYFRGSQSIEINKEELFPEGYESKLLICGINVIPHGRYYAFEHINPGNGVVKVNFQDTDDGRTAFSPYRVSIYLDCLTD